MAPIDPVQLIAQARESLKGYLAHSAALYETASHANRLQPSEGQDRPVADLSDRLERVYALVAQQTDEEIR